MKRLERLRLSRRLLFALVLGGLAALLGGLACGAGDFDSQSKVNSVRIFGVRADKPYAKPGETVTLDVLAADARRDKARPLKIFWIPFVCLNPREDLYYLCFLSAQGVDGGAGLLPPFPLDAGVLEAGAAALADGGASANPLDRIPRGIDLGPFLPQGVTFRFQMPPNAIQPRQGSAPYGLAIVFNIACAGQVRIVERTGNNPQQVPIECTDEIGNPLPPSDYVIGINRVYSYDDRTNTNPVVEGVTLDDAGVDLEKGFTVDHCVAEKRADCKAVKMDVRVSRASQETSPGGPFGPPANEQIWVTYYSDLGDLADEARLLYDTKAGQVTETAVEYRPPYQAGEGTVWAVVHDNRAGAAFLVIPLHVK
jgi:hypothetical protein